MKGRLVAEHRATNAEVTIAAVPVTRERAPGLGVLRLDDGRVTHFVEKPRIDEQLEPLKVPADRLHSMLGITDAVFVRGRDRIALIDSTLAA